MFAMRRAIPLKFGSKPYPEIRFANGATNMALGKHKKDFPMTSSQRSRLIFIPFALILAFLTIGLGGHSALGASVTVPTNARAVSYGSGWECRPGYRAVGKDCAAVEAPENSFLTNTSYGLGWECHHGFQQIKLSCVAIKVPANAYLNAFGDNWECKRGYRTVGKSCTEVQVPANGYLATSYGPGWRCERGYRAVKDACVAVVLPENAHLDFSGNDWACNRPFQRQKDKCHML